jgi:hypothetical protein
MMIDVLQVHTTLTDLDLRQHVTRSENDSIIWRRLEP